MANLSSQSLGWLQKSLIAFLDDLGGLPIDETVTKIDTELLYEQLEDLYYDIESARKKLDAAHYLSTTSFANGGKKVKPDNINTINKANAELRKIGMSFKDEYMVDVLKYYNKYFTGVFNPYVPEDDIDYDAFN